MSLARDSSSQIGIVTTSPYQVALFLRSHLADLPMSITPLIFTNTNDPYSDLVADLDVRHIPIGRAPFITRDDVLSGQQLRRELDKNRVQSVVTMSPKAGLVGQIAARAARVDRRLHIFTGQVWDGLDSGPRRTILTTADRVIGRTATHLAADSPSQAQNLKEWRVAPRGKAVTVPHGPGSIRGVDLEVFQSRPASRARLREVLKLPPDAVAFVHLGRISVAKGIHELAEAFGRVRAAWRNGTTPHEPRLFVVGRDEGQLASGLRDRDGIAILPFTPHPEEILAAMDVLVLASHREGFGTTIIEAAAMGLPSVGTDIVGIRDAIVAGETGWLVPRRSVIALQAVLAAIVRNRAEIEVRGSAARKRAVETFGAAQVGQAWVKYLTAVHRGEI